MFTFLSLPLCHLHLRFSSLQVFGRDPEHMLVSEMLKPVQRMVETLRQKMDEKNLGAATTKLERFAMVFDPRRKGSTLCMSGVVWADTLQEIKLELLAVYPEDFDGAQQAQQEHPPEPLPPAVRPPASQQPLNVLQRRLAERVARAGAEEARRNYQHPAGSSLVEFVAYIKAPLEPEAKSFSLAQYWKEKEQPKLDVDGKTILAPATWPKLARFAARYVSMEATSCEAERNFSALSQLMDDKRCTLLPATVEKCMLLRLNRSLLPGFAKLSALQERRQENCQKIVALICDTLAARNATTAVAQKQHVACGAAAAGSIAAGGDGLAAAATASAAANAAAGEGGM